MQKQIYTMLDIEQSKAYRENISKMVKTFGYQPVHGATLGEIRYGQRLMSQIVRVYPGFKWVLEIRKGLVRLLNLTLHSSWGLCVAEKDLDSDGKVIISKVGELLDSLGYPPGPAKDDLIKLIPRDTRGDCLLVKGVA